MDVAGKILAVSIAAALACAAPRTVPPPPLGSGEAEAREVLRRFARAVQDERWDEAALLASARWRSPEGARRLALDFRGAGPAARESAERVLRALDGGVALVLGSRVATLPLGPDRAARLVLEPEGWRVDALE